MLCLSLNNKSTAQESIVRVHIYYLFHIQVVFNWQTERIMEVFCEFFLNRRGKRFIKESSGLRIPVIRWGEILHLRLAKVKDSFGFFTWLDQENGKYEKI